MCIDMFSDNFYLFVVIWLVLFTKTLRSLKYVGRFLSVCRLLIVAVFTMDLAVFSACSFLRVVLFSELWTVTVLVTGQEGYVVIITLYFSVHPEITWKYFGKTLPARMVWAARMEKLKPLQIGLNVCRSVGILYVLKGT